MIRFSQKVKDAIKNGEPLVALESTIIAHGMPYPQNLKVAKQVKVAVESFGAVAATAAVIEGQLCLGLEEDELEMIATQKVLKVSRRDFGHLISQKLSGATTVSGTMIIAALAKVKVFATGGIGGVHRGVEGTWDISADLTELEKTKVAVVSAGAKSILDLPKTVEVLETYGVPVVGYQTDCLPSFYNSKSDIPLQYSYDKVEQVSDFLKGHWSIPNAGGVLVANPIPLEAEIEKELIDESIATAIREAQSKDIKGKELTPFLLSKIVDLTSGESLKSNVALVLNNAKLAAQIAVELAQKPV